MKKRVLRSIIVVTIALFAPKSFCTSDDMLGLEEADAQVLSSLVEEPAPDASPTEPSPSAPAQPQPSLPATTTPAAPTSTAAPEQPSPAQKVTTAVLSTPSAPTTPPAVAAPSAVPSTTVPSGRVTQPTGPTPVKPRSTPAPATPKVPPSPAPSSTQSIVITEQEAAKAQAPISITTSGKTTVVTQQALQEAAAPQPTEALTLEDTPPAELTTVSPAPATRQTPPSFRRPPVTPALRSTVAHFDLANVANVTTTPATAKPEQKAFNIDDFDITLPSEEELKPTTETTPQATVKTAQEEKEEADIGIPLDVPIIGTIVLMPFTDEHGKTGFKAKFADTDRKITIGPLTIDDGTISILDNKLGITGRFTLLGKQATFGLQKAELDSKNSFKKVVLETHFINKPTVEIAGKSITLNEVNVILEKGQPIIIESKTDLFNQPVTPGIVISRQGAHTYTTLNDTPLSKIIPAVKDTPLSAGIITEAKVYIKNIWVPVGKPQERETYFKGTFGIKPHTQDSAHIEFSPPPKKEKKEELTGARADFRPTKKEEKKKDYTGMEIEITVSSKGTKASIDASLLPLTHIGTLKQAHISIDTTEEKNDTTEEKKSMEVSGDLDLDVSDLGTLTIKVKSSIEKEGIKFAGSIDSDISYAGFSLKGFTASYSTEKKAITLEGKITLHGLDLQAKIEVIPDKKNPTKKALNLVAHGITKEFKPFADSGIPGINTFSITDFDAGISLQRKDGKITTALSLDGDFHFMGQAVKSLVKFVQNAQNIRGVYVNAPLSHDKTLSDFIPALKGPVFDGINFKEASFMASNIEFKDLDTNTDVKKGLTFRARVPLSGTLRPAGRLLGKTDQIFTLYGKIIPDSPRLSEFGILLSEGKPDPDAKFSMGDMSVELSGEPAFGVASSMYFRNSGDLYELTGKFLFKESTVDLQASLTGTIKNIVGVSGWSLKDPAVLLGMTYGSPGIPTEIGGSAELMIGDFDLAITFLVDALLKNMAFKGQAHNNLGILEGVGILAKPFHLNIPTDNLPDITIRDIGAQFATKDSKIGNVIIPQGFAANGKMNLLGKTAELEIRADTGGIKAYGGLDPVDLAGVLKITGRGDKHKPEIDIELTPTRQKFLITGRLEIADIFSTETFITINKHGFEFKFEENVGGTRFMWQGKPLLYSLIEGIGELSSFDAVMTIQFKQYLLAWLKDNVDAGVKGAKEAVEKGIGIAKDQIDKIETVIKEADEKIKDARDKVASAKNALQKIVAAKESAQHTLREAQERVDSIKREIHDLDSWYDSLPNF